MKDIEFSFEDAMLSQNSVTSTAEKLKIEIGKIANALPKGCNDDMASINLLDDKNMLRNVKQVIADDSQLNPECLIVVGIGGSNLGTIAVQEAVLGKLYNQLTASTKVLYADTVDADYIDNIIALAKSALEKNGNILLDVISKSGTTTETIANAQVLMDLMRAHKKDYERYVNVTSDKDSKLWNLALREGFKLLEIPGKVGGRYSVFSPVGLLPLGLLGVNIEDLLDGARSMRDICINMNVEENPAAMSAVIQYLHYKSGKNVFDLFLFANDFESLGKWYRQLMAESLGKEFNRKGEKVNVGMTPTVSIGSTDLHSMAQLYLGGPYDKLTTFVKVKESRACVDVPIIEGYSELVSGIQGTSLSDIMKAILEGTEEAFRIAKRPFTEITMPNKSEYSVGQLMQFKMMETIYLARLLEVNPFDQPNVESYKKETRRILAAQN
jgi:glucose-6-phosphate isomerase